MEKTGRTHGDHRKFLLTADFTGNAIIERKNPTGSSHIIPFKVLLSVLSSLSVLWG